MPSDNEDILEEFKNVATRTLSSPKVKKILAVFVAAGLAIAGTIGGALACLNSSDHSSHQVLSPTPGVSPMQGGDVNKLPAEINGTSGGNDTTLLANLPAKLNGERIKWTLLKNYGNENSTSEVYEASPEVVAPDGTVAPVDGSPTLLSRDRTNRGDPRARLPELSPDENKNIQVPRDLNQTAYFKALNEGIRTLKCGRYEADVKVLDAERHGFTGLFSSEDNSVAQYLVNGKVKATFVKVPKYAKKQGSVIGCVFNDGFPIGCHPVPKRIGESSYTGAVHLVSSNGVRGDTYENLTNFRDINGTYIEVAEPVQPGFVETTVELKTNKYHKVVGGNRGKYFEPYPVPYPV
jgi:hypothetical protein